MGSAAFSSLAASRHSIRDFLLDLIASNVLDSILEDAGNAPNRSNIRPHILAPASGEQVDRLCSAYVETWKKWLAQMAKDKNANANGPAEGLPDGDYEGWRPYPDELRARSVDLGKKFCGHLDIGREDRERRNAPSRRNYGTLGVPVIGFILVWRGFMPWAVMDADLMLQTLLPSAKVRGVD